MNNKKTNRAVADAVDGAAYWAVSGDVDDAVSWAVSDAMSLAVDTAVDVALYWALDGAVPKDSAHPGFQDFLIEVGGT